MNIKKMCSRSREIKRDRERLAQKKLQLGNKKVKDTKLHDYLLCKIISI